MVRASLLDSVKSLPFREKDLKLIREALSSKEDFKILSATLSLKEILQTSKMQKHILIFFLFL